MSKMLSDKFIKELFELGASYSDPVEVLPNIKVVFRLLTPEELLEVSEKMAEYSGIESKVLVSQIQTLARAIVEINGLVLILPPGEVTQLEKKTGKKFTQVEQAAHILSTQFPKFLIDELNEAYLNFHRLVLSKVDDIKKKSKPQSKTENLTNLPS